MKTLRLGLIVNPVAGLGGSVGLKGSDGLSTQHEALRRGATPQATQRAERMLGALSNRLSRVTILTGAGELGADVATRVTGQSDVVFTPQHPGPTTAEHTRTLAKALVSHGVDLLVFVGGDGTARDLSLAVGTGQRVLGVPAGVKMHSGVFALTPEVAATIIVGEMTGQPKTKIAEVVDIDEEARRRGILTSTLHGHLLIPDGAHQVQHGKSGPDVSEPVHIQAVAAGCIDKIDLETLCLLGPGTTIGAVSESYGISSTLLGVDAVHRGALLGLDVSGTEAFDLLGSRRLQVVVSPIGGQGMILGRGNQQIDSRLLELLEPDDLIIACTSRKLGELGGGPLYIDAPTEYLNQKFAGMHKVVLGPGQNAMVRIQAA